MSAGSSCSIPTGEREPAQRASAARLRALAQSDDRPARHLQAARRRLPRSPRGAARRRAAPRVVRFTQADLHQAGAARPAPADRRALRRGDRSARRLRVLHVVQCARHDRPRRTRHPDRVRRVEGVRRRGVDAGGRRWAPIRRASSSRIRSRTAPTTRCARSRTRRSTRSWRSY